MSRIRVLVVDDSASMRKILTSILNSDPDIEVVGSAMDAYVARDKIKQLKPDVLTLDVEMPKMDGLTFLGNLMRLHPLPVVMVSSLTVQGADLTMRALKLGAVDFVSKPKVGLVHTLEDCAAEITTKVKVAAEARVDSLVEAANSSDQPYCIDDASSKTISPAAGIDSQTAHRVIAIGASTGGTEAIKEVLIRMRPDCPGIVITQHIPPVFSRSFADRMNQCSRLSICEARDGQQILPGHAFIAPGDRHLEVVRDGSRYHCRLDDGEPVNRHKPSVDVLFDSVATSVGGKSIGVILTGMGKDGAMGLKRMREAGAATVAQDEQTSTIWGMPRAAIEQGGAERILPLENIAAKLTELGKVLGSRVAV